MQNVDVMPINETEESRRDGGEAVVGCKDSVGLPKPQRQSLRHQLLVVGSIVLIVLATHKYDAAK